MGPQGTSSSASLGPLLDSIPNCWKLPNASATNSKGKDFQEQATYTITAKVMYRNLQKKQGHPTWTEKNRIPHTRAKTRGPILQKLPYVLYCMGSTCSWQCSVPISSCFGCLACAYSTRVLIRSHISSCFSKMLTAVSWSTSGAASNGEFRREQSMEGLHEAYTGVVEGYSLGDLEAQ